jgi:epoxyqueuosine reductase
MLSDLSQLLPHDVMIGATSLEPFEHVRGAIRDRIATGMSGGLGFVYRDPDMAAEPQTSFPWGRSIVVVAVPYLRPGDGTTSELANGGAWRPVARFADGDRYERVRGCLDVIAGYLARAGHRTESVVDDDRLVDRAVAVRAGIGWPGKSTMVITPTAGPWVLIGSVVTDADVTSSDPMVRGCGSCVACIPACPTGAIVAPGVLDARKCLAAVLQQPGIIDPSLRSLVGGRVYGCDACLIACPPGDKVALQLASRTPGPSAREVLNASDRVLGDVTAHWYVPRRSYRFVRRNALVALGNTGADDDVGLLGGYLGHPDPLLRSHAAWALGAIGGDTGRAVLQATLTTERDPDVLGEIRSALS